MATQAVYARILPQGLSESSLRYEEAIVGASATAADTLTVNPPDGIDKLTTRAVTAVAYRPQNSPPDLYQALTLTSFDPTTGILTLTVPSGGTLAAGDKILLTLFENV